jgi:hypothetical protein
MRIAIAALSVCFFFSVTASAEASWPLAPINQQHPIRAGWLDLRSRLPGTFGIHRGIDIVDDQTRISRMAPPRGAHRVYAIAGGVVWELRRYSAVIKIGRWGYGHVLPCRKLGERIHAGEFIGWSLRGLWHIHVSLWNKTHTIKINPLSQAGLNNSLTPLTDTFAPIIFATQYNANTDELDAEIEDPHETPAVQARVPARMLDYVAPYGISVDGTTLWTAAHDPVPGLPSIIGPETVRNLPAPACGEDPSLAAWTDITQGGCLGQRWWDLGTFPPGDAVVISAWDGLGNKETETLSAATATLHRRLSRSS